MSALSDIGDLEIKNANSELASQKIKLDEISLKNSGFEYNNDTVKPVNAGMDFNHLSIRNCMVEAREILYSSQIFRILFAHVIHKLRKEIYQYEFLFPAHSLLLHRKALLFRAHR